MYTQYKILSSGALEDLEELVKEAISEGWQPTGGVSVDNNTFTLSEGYWKWGGYRDVVTNTSYLQAMVK